MSDLIKIIEKLRLEGKYKDCYNLCIKCEDLIDENVLNYNLALIGYKCGEGGRKRGLQGCENVLFNSDQKNYHEEIKKIELKYLDENIYVLIIDLKILEALLIKKGIDLKIYHTNNPSILKYKDFVLLNIRLTCHRKNNDEGIPKRSRDIPIHHGEYAEARNILFSCRIKWNNLYDIKLLGELKTNSDYFKNIRKNDIFRGIEDIRLFERDNVLYGLGTIWETPSTYNQMCFIEIGLLADILKYGNEDIIFKKNIFIDYGKDVCQKNWLPIQNINKMLYSLSPTILLNYDEDGKILSMEKKENKYPNLKGSSQILHMNGEYVGLFHECRGIRFKEEYLSRFVIFNDKFEIIGMTCPFRMFHLGIEFVCGMFYQDGIYYISGSKNDEEIFIIGIDEKWINSNLVPL